MKIGDTLIYIGNKNDRHMRKNEKYVLIVMYESDSDKDLIGVQLFDSDNEEDFFIRYKKNFLSIKEYRKRKLIKLNQLV